MAPKIVQVTERVGLGEAPHWDVATQSLFFVDVLGKTIHKYNPSTNKHTKAHVGEKQVSFIIPIEGEKDQYVISLGKQLVKIFWDGEASEIKIIETLAEVESSSSDKLHNRFNDGKCDPSGRLWAGTLNTIPERHLIYPPKGTLYSLDADKDIRVHLENLRISNGIAFNPDLKKMYFIDSSTGIIDQYDYDQTNGTISNYTAIFTLATHDIDGIPDGMTIDADGNLWIAIFNGNKVIKIDPRRPETLLNILELPARQVTSVAFGGLHLDELYVTTGAFKIDNADISGSENGAVFKVTNLGTRGLRAVKFRLNK